MPIAGYTTEVTTQRSLEHIMKLLVKGRARQIAAIYDEDGTAVGMWFTIETEFGVREYQLPIRVKGVQATLIRDRVAPRYQTIDHAARVAWRLAHDWLRVQLALIDAGMTTLPEVMLPYSLVAPETTMWDAWVQRQGAIER
jgi:hypothetical protein